MAISRITAVWTGFSGAPGYTNFFFRAFGVGDLYDAETTRVRDFFSAFSAFLPDDVVVQVQNEVAILEESSGSLIGYGLADGDISPVEGGAPGAYSAPTGGSITWNTDTVARGRRLRGRTFIVPLGNGSYDDDGTLSSLALQNLREGASALIGDGSGPELVVWSRPQNGAGGSIGDVTSATVRDVAAVLRSRRD